MTSNDLGYFAITLQPLHLGKTFRQIERVPQFRFAIHKTISIAAESAALTPLPVRLLLTPLHALKPPRRDAQSCPALAKPPGPIPHRAPLEIFSVCLCQLFLRPLLELTPEHRWLADLP